MKKIIPCNTQIKLPSLVTSFLRFGWSGNTNAVIIAERNSVEPKTKNGVMKPPTCGEHKQLLTVYVRDAIFVFQSPRVYTYTHTRVYDRPDTKLLRRWARRLDQVRKTSPKKPTEIITKNGLLQHVRLVRLFCRFFFFFLQMW